MTRIKVAFVILILTICLCIFSNAKINSEIQKFIDITEEIEYEVRNENTEDALILAEKMNTEWEKSFRWLKLVIKHEKLLNVYNSIIKLEPLIEKNNDDILAETAGIKSMLYKIN